LRGPRRLTVPEVAFSGEVWTDARGYATLRCRRRPGGCTEAHYELRPFAAGVTVRIAAELSDGRFTVATDQPLVKVAWRVTGRRLQDKARASSPREEER
jgi:hypothetical protein